MSKFELPKTIVAIKPQSRNSQLGLRLDEDLIEPFHRAKRKSGLSLNRFVGMMIRHCLKDLGEME